MKYKVIVHPGVYEDWHEMVEWCNKIVGPPFLDWEIVHYNPFTFGFMKKGDASMFALKFVW